LVYLNVINNDENRKKLDFWIVGITVCGLTGLALLVGNVIITWNFYKQRYFESANSGQVRVETVVMQIFFIFGTEIIFLWKAFI